MFFFIKVIYDLVYDMLEFNKFKFKSKIYVLVDKYIYFSFFWDIIVLIL